MAELREISLGVSEVAELLHVQPQTVTRRLRGGELERAETIGPGPASVRLVPAETWLRVEDASALLGVSPATVRSNITRGRLTGRREKSGRWRVLLRSVLEDSRCDPAALEVFTGERVADDEEQSPNRPRRPSSLHRSVFLRLTEEEAELLERARDRHGTIRAAVVVGLQAIDLDDLDDTDELRAEHALYREQTERLRAAHRGLRDRAEGRLVDELYCQVCESWVPVEECSAAEIDEKGTLEVFHEIHGHRSGSRFRSDSGLARRGPITHAAEL